MEDNFNESSQVSLIEVKAVEYKKFIKDDLTAYEATFSIIESFKVNQDSVTKVHTFILLGSCGLDLEIGLEYVVFIPKDSDGFRFVSNCQGSFKVRSNNEYDLNKLDSVRNFAYNKPFKQDK